VFTPGQPDLNYNNPDVIKEMKANIKFWLDFNIDGFRVDAVSWLFEDPRLRDEPLSGLPGADPTSTQYLKPIYTTNLDATYDMIYQFRAVLDEYNQNVNYSRIMMTEAYGDTAEAVARYYGNSTTAGAQFTFNFNLISDLDSSFTVDDIIRIVNKWFSHLDENYVSNWVLGNHDRHRVASRLGVSNVDAFNMLAGFLPGVQVVYMGEEIGMENGAVTCEQGWDPQAIKNCSIFQQTSRDFERTPYQWDDTDNAGFSTNKLTWLPVSDKYKTTNLKAQNVTGQKTHYNVYKNMVKLRHDFKNISYDAVSLIKLTDNVVQIIRKTNLAEYVYLFNTGNVLKPVNIFGIGDSYIVSVPSVISQDSVGTIVKNPIMLHPHESIILTALITP
jgi:alpha-glucosidase